MLILMAKNKVILNINVKDKEKNLKEKTIEELIYTITGNKVDISPGELKNATPESLEVLGFQIEEIDVILAAMELSKRASL